MRLAHRDVATDEAIGDHAHAVRDLLFLGLQLVQPDTRDLGLEEHDGGEGLVTDGARLEAEHRLDGVAPFELRDVDERDVHRGVASRVDVRSGRGARVLHDDSSALVELHARGLEAEVLRRGGSAHGDERALDANGLRLALLAVRDDVLDLAVDHLEALQLGGAMNHDAHRLEARRDLLGDVLVLEGEDARLAVDDVDACLAEVGEDRRVLAADDAGADDHHALGERFERLDLIARDDQLSVDRDAVGHARLGARREEEALRLDHLDRAVEALHLERMRRDEAATPANERDDAAIRRGRRERGELPVEQRAALGDRRAHRLDHVRIRDLDPAGRVVPAIGTGSDRVVVREMPHRLRRERPCMDAGATDLPALDDHDAFAEIVRAHGRRISTRTRTDDAQVPCPACHPVRIRRGPLLG
jgi:hypothetical protein